MPGAAAAGAKRARHAGQHAAGADRAAEHVDAAGLFEQLATDFGVAVERVGVVELIGPERVGFSRQNRDLLAELVRTAPA